MEIGLDQGHGDARFDVAIIGAGVIGCAMARRFTLEGARVVVLEKAADVLDGASKGNSAILHTGFDAPENSLELTCVRQGYAEYRQIHEALNLPLDPCGALVLAWSEEQEAELAGLMAQARRNGIDDLERLDRAQVLQREPNLAEGVVGGFRVPGESLIDPWSRRMPICCRRCSTAPSCALAARCRRRGSRATAGSCAPAVARWWHAP